MIELLEYVLRKVPLPSTFGIEVCPRTGREREEPDEVVSNESVPGSVPCSDDVVGNAGTGGISSDGARKPFLVVVDDRLGEKISFAFGADATRLIKRGSTPMDLLGDRGGN